MTPHLVLSTTFLGKPIGRGEKERRQLLSIEKGKEEVQDPRARKRKKRAESRRDALHFRNQEKQGEESSERKRRGVSESDEERGNNLGRGGRSAGKYPHSPRANRVKRD